MIRGKYSTICADNISGNNYIAPGKNYCRREVPEKIYSKHISSHMKIITVPAPITVALD